MLNVGPTNLKGQSVIQNEQESFYQGDRCTCLEQCINKALLITDRARKGTLTLMMHEHIYLSTDNSHLGFWEG